MTDRGSDQSPLQAAAGAAGPQTVDAFKLLSNETRLAILLALWEYYDPHHPADSVTFSELYDRVSLRDSGTFTYHLDKLVGHYVEETDGGYRLRNSGLKIVRSVIAGSGLEERHLPPTEIPRSCYFCDVQLHLSYQDERLYQVCPECDGRVGPDSTERAPAGTLVVYDNFNPAGLAGRSPGEVFVAGTIEYHRVFTLLIRGVCPECSGHVEESLELCDDHEASTRNLCSTCGTVDEARVRYTCSVCKYGGSYPAWAAVFDHPSIITFYHDHGFEMTFGLDDPVECGRLWDRLWRDQTLVSRDPVRIRVRVPYEDEELHLTLDEDLDVLEVSEVTVS